jgi:hypothetical protein
LYYLYIDESGTDDDYLDEYYNVSGKRSKYFTLGGIIVSEDTRQILNKHYYSIISRFFKGICLPTNFKLHYHDLRRRKYPFSQLKDEERWLIADQMFNGIKLTKSYLVSVTIDKEKHCKRYSRPVNPTGYGLYLMLERFQYFLEEHEDIGFAIFERFNSKMRKMVERVHKWLEFTGSFPIFTNFENIIRHVTNGNPAKEPLLQYAVNKPGK